MSKRWTFEEELIVKNNFDKMGSDIVLLLPDRTLSAIKERVKVIMMKEEAKKLRISKWDKILYANICGINGSVPENLEENFEKACNVLEDLGGAQGCAVLRMFYKEGMEYDEIAYNLGLDKDKVRIIHHRFITKMRNPAIRYILIHGETIASKKYAKDIIGRVDLDIETLNLSSRSYNTLKRGGVNTIEQLVSMSESDLRRLRYMNDNVLDEIKIKLDARKLKLAD